MKEKILNISSIDELEELENNILEEYRNNLYNELLKDDESELNPKSWTVCK